VSGGSTAVTAEGVRTARLVLEPLRPAHAGPMARVLADPALYAFTGGEPPSVEELRARYERWARGPAEPDTAWCNWVLREAGAGGEPVGTVQATVHPVAGTAEVAWIVGTPWQGRGYAAEAARALVGWLAAKGVRKVVAHIHPDHHASGAVAAAAGLVPTDGRQEGEVRWEWIAPDAAPSEGSANEG
jgi:RimJ/RimL family protein N-acetyltransferase